MVILMKLILELPNQTQVPKTIQIIMLVRKYKDLNVELNSFLSEFKILIDLLDLPLITVIDKLIFQKCQLTEIPFI